MRWEKELLEYLEERIYELQYSEPKSHDDSLVSLGGRLAYQEIKKYVEKQKALK